MQSPSGERQPQPSSSDGPANTPPPPRSRGRTALIAVFVLALVCGLVWLGVRHKHSGPTSRSPAAGKGPGMSGPVPVIAGIVTQKDVPIYLDGLGTVQAFNTVMVRVRVDGQVQKIAFTEGQDVREGDLLAQIDPAPFQAQLDQALARQAQDQAQLTVARITLERDAKLLADKILSQQEYDTQKATVEQLAAGIQADQAAINNAKVQLAYTTINAPLSGRTGIRLVDQGNIIHASGDSNVLTLITQLRPISVVFTLPEQHLRQIQEELGAGHQLPVLAVDRDNRTVLDQGTLAVIDNQIDTGTGSIRLKATFPNEKFHLWPGQFVNARLLVTTRRNGAVVPASVVQRGPNGAYAFVVNKDLSTEMRPVEVAHIEQGEALISSGLQPGEQVVVDGQYKLQPGSHVKLTMTNTASGTAPSRRTAGGSFGNATHTP